MTLGRTMRRRLSSSLAAESSWQRISVRHAIVCHLSLVICIAENTQCTLKDKIRVCEHKDILSWFTHVLVIFKTQQTIDLRMYSHYRKSHQQVAVVLQESGKFHVLISFRQCIKLTIQAGKNGMDATQINLAALRHVTSSPYHVHT